MSDETPHLRIIRHVDRTAVVPTNAEMEAALVSIDAAGAMLPSERWVGRCYVCGRTAELTEEHIPPRSAFNKERTRKISLDDLLGRDELELPDSGEVTQGGIRGFTLCDSCNNLTGVRWGREYHEWAKSLVMLIQAIYSKHGDLDGMTGFPAATDVTFRTCYPARLLRQALSMFLSLSGGPDLAEQYPDLRALVLGEAPRSLPSPLSLYFQAYAGPIGRFVGGRGAIRHDLATGELQRLMQIDFVPMSFMLLLDGPPLDTGTDISEFATYEVDTKSTLTFETIHIGFGHTPFPTDYRTKAQILAGRR